jgi:hypothetical protein
VHDIREILIAEENNIFDQSEVRMYHPPHISPRITGAADGYHGTSVEIGIKQVLGNAPASHVPSAQLLPTTTKRVAHYQCR